LTSTHNRLRQCSLHPSHTIAYHGRYIEALCRQIPASVLGLNRRQPATTGTTSASVARSDDPCWPTTGNNGSLPVGLPPVPVLLDEEWEQVLLQTMELHPGSLQASMHDFLFS
jgi:hypothetical protein